MMTLARVTMLMSIYMLLSFSSAFAQSGPALESSLQVQTETTQAAIRSQEKIDRLADETEQLLKRYRETLQQTASLQTYTRQLERLMTSQQQELASLETQLQEIEVTQREILPLLVRMVERLEQFIALDIPFLPEERQTRLAHLREWLDQSDMTIAEKYRRIMEAYQAETEYGRTIEAYRGSVQLEGQEEQERTVDVLRVGRLALLFLSLDGQQVGQWNRQTKQWQILPNSYRRSIAQGLSIAKKQAAPQLLSLPIPAPVEVSR